MSRTGAKALATAAIFGAAGGALALTVAAGPIVGVIAVILLGIGLAAGIHVEARKHVESLIDAMMAGAVTIICLFFAVAAISVDDAGIAASAGGLAVGACIYAIWRVSRVVDVHFTQHVR